MLWARGRVTGKRQLRSYGITMKFTTAVFTAMLAGRAAATIYYAGVAESGGEFGVWSQTSTPGTGLPGRFGVDYQFISESAIDTHVDKNKINLFRVAFLMERMCPLSTGLGSKFNETHFDLYKKAVDYITVKKGACKCSRQDVTRPKSAD